MRQKKTVPGKPPAEDMIRDIRRATRRHFSAEEKIRIVLEGLRGEESIAEICRHRTESAGSRGVADQPERPLRSVRVCADADSASLATGSEIGAAESQRKRLL